MPVIRADQYYRKNVPQDFFRDVYVFEIAPEMVKHAPIWKSLDELPPLAPGDAAKVAVAQLVSSFPLIPDWKVDSVTLQRVFPDGWLYVVEASDATTPIAGVPWCLSVPVFLDGRTVPPKLLFSRDPTQSLLNRKPPPQDASSPFVPSALDVQKSKSETPK
jgi:hypothetical protein